jgi:glycosyltransferase involved in cell wall biosynthesis
MPQPTAAQQEILRDLAAAADTTVVMSRAASTLLTRTYGADPSRVAVIPHGVPNFPIVAADTMKSRIGLNGQTVILSFGLLGPGKGYESAIEAMPEVIKAVPSACYVILGATHPEVRARDGEAYRASLEARVAALGLGDHVKFVNRFVGRVELGTWLQAADVFVTPYPNLYQSVSGTLAYAMGAGKAIVSTPYAYAAEMLAGECGRLVEPGSSTALSEAFIELLLNPDLRASMGRRAYEHSRGMVWWEVGSQYRRLFDRAARLVVTPVRRNNKLAAVVA